MNPWICFLLIATAGSIGGFLNAMMSELKVAMPSYPNGIWCPGVIGNLLIGACSAVISWSLYGAGAAVQFSDIQPRTRISFTFSALAGAAMVGVAGARWLTNESDKNLLRASVGKAITANRPPDKCQEILDCSPVEMLAKLSEDPASIAKGAAA